ncbi:MAG TPA: hypothetical protein DD381_02205 [Lentisphaeria bacterium]|nr:MAG: hypothetical protein A2X47_08830 [Lentisphaerae bacterium GWF2_38_69]HBM15149.1 hypothetical protein [Lentisphaeria bacterium]
MKNLIFISLFLLSISSLAMPEHIIIIRHGDGYYVPARKEELGPSLSKEGMIRSSVFLKYYIETLQGAKKIPYPNYIFACDPYYAKAEHKMAQSVRHIQTVSPLVTWIYEHKADTPDDLLQIPYRKDEYKEMAQLITEQEYLNGKTILVCWSHEVINDLIKNLRITSGYSAKSNWPEEAVWEGGDYESIIIIGCDNKNKTMTVERVEGALKIPPTREEKQELGKWFFSQFSQ